MKILTLTALALMTIGIFVGVAFVTNPQLRQTSTEAAVPPELVEVSNQDVTIEFTSLNVHNRWDYMLSGAVCFTNTPPGNGRWKVSVYHDGLSNPTLPIGASVEKIVTVPSAARCNGAPHLLFNAPINLPPSSRLPEGVECLPAGDVKVRVDTAGPPWMLQREVATISNAYFCPDGNGNPNPTVNPNTTPTPAPPGDVNMTVQLQGTWKAGFNEVQTTAMTCDYNADNTVHWETCGEGANKRSNIDVTRKGAATINKTINLTIDDAAGGHKALVLFYDYKREDGKADNTGIRVEPINGTTCDDAYIDFGAHVCEVELPASGISKSFKLTLPDATATTYELILGTEDATTRTLLQTCTHAIDSNNKHESSARGQCNSYVTDNKVKVVYYNSTTANEKIFWNIARCNGTIDDNTGVCEVNADDDSAELVRNYFDQETATTLNAGQVLVCTMDKSKYPATEDLASVRSSGVVTCEATSPTATPVPTATLVPTATPVATNTPTPRPPTNTPAPVPGAGFYTSISFFNGSSRAVTSITSITCYGPQNNECNSELINTSIAPNQRGVVETNLVLPQNVNSYSIKCKVTFEGNNTPVNCPNEVTTPLRQNVLYRIVASEAGTVQGTGVTEIQACDVNKDQCCNANDFSVIATKYAEEVKPADQNPSDVNGDDIINGFDLAYAQTNFGKGEGCSLNLAPELNPEN